MDLNLSGRRAIVTGGSRGIGAAIVDQLLAEGCSVATCARNQAGIKAVQARHGDHAHSLHAGICDVADSEAYARWLDDAVKALGGVDIFIPNVSAVAVSGADTWQQSFNVDMMATVRGCEQLLPALAQSDAASIVIIASISGLESSGAASAYGVMKAGLVSYASQLGDAVGSHGVRVNAVSPGPIYVDDGFWGQVSRDQPDMFAAVAGRHAAGRLGTPDEVANAVVFLASSAASWITRSNLVVDGGFSRRIQY